MLDVLILIPEITKGMKSLGSKALLKIKNTTTILQHQVDQLRKYHPKCRIFLGTGFESDKIKKAFYNYSNVIIVENNDYSITNQTKIVSSLIEEHELTQLLVISNGILFKNNPFLCDNQSRLFLIDKPKHNFTIGCNESEQIHYLFYDLPIPWSECVVFDKRAIDQIKHLESIQNIDQLYLFELINILIEKYDLKFVKSHIKKKDIMKINSIKDIPRAKIFI
jgi:hypothetical protein